MPYSLPALRTRPFSWAAAMLPQAQRRIKGDALGPYEAAHDSKKFPPPLAGGTDLNIKAEEDDVAVLHDIFLALAAHKALLLGGGHAAAGAEAHQRR